MLAFRNFSICAALLSMVAFTLTGCCSGNCGLLGGGAASAPAVSSGCSTCGGGTSFSQPTQSFSNDGFSGGSGTVNVPTAAGSGSVNLPSVNAGGQSFGGGSISVPSVGGSGIR